MGAQGQASEVRIPGNLLYWQLEAPTCDYFGYLKEYSPGVTEKVVLKPSPFPERLIVSPADSLSLQTQKKQQQQNANNITFTF